MNILIASGGFASLSLHVSLAALNFFSSSPWFEKNWALSLVCELSQDTQLAGSLKKSEYVIKLFLVKCFWSKKSNLGFFAKVIPNFSTLTPQKNSFPYCLTTFFGLPWYAGGFVCVWVTLNFGVFQDLCLVLSHK